MRSTASLAALAILLVASVAEARCAPVSPEREVREAAHVVEATLERIENDQMIFRVVASYKGQAPATVRLGIRRGRGTWASPSDVGTAYLLFLRTNPSGGLYVMRCGATSRLSQARRALEALRAAGLRRQPR